MNADARRREYLKALGVDCYRPRGAVAPASASASHVESAVIEPAPPAAQPPPADWESLRARVNACRACTLGSTRTNAVFGVGNPAADLLIVGEAPGAEEDRRGEPFVGRAGQLLDEMLRAIEFTRDDVFIVNMLKCRPPNNRDPLADELAACRGYLEQQIAHVAPRLLLAVGRIAAQALLDVNEPLGRLRGRAHHHDAWAAPVIVTYHPAYLLRTPAQKARSWQDLKQVRRILRES
ncbi:MAG: uracil-DNA glycosylase [Pseudomonadota bacterium]